MKLSALVAVCAPLHLRSCLGLYTVIPQPLELGSQKTTLPQHTHCKNHELVPLCTERLRSHNHCGTAPLAPAHECGGRACTFTCAHALRPMNTTTHSVICVATNPAQQLLHPHTCMHVKPTDPSGRHRPTWSAPQCQNTDPRPSPPGPAWNCGR